MNIATQISASPNDTGTQIGRPKVYQVPKRRVSDIWRAPIHDYPIRDQMLHQFMQFTSDMDILEVGPGSGFTAFELSRSVKSMTLVDVAAEAVSSLAQELGSIRNLRFVRADACAPDFHAKCGMQFDAIFALDMFEYVPNPTACLRNFALLLRPGGLLYLTFPNVAPPRGDGITWFNKSDDLRSVLLDAGFTSHTIERATIRRYAKATYALLHDWPLQMYRQFRAASKGSRIQTYEATWAFQNKSRLKKVKPVIHFWWLILASLLKLGGRVFDATSAGPEILGSQLVVMARK